MNLRWRTGVVIALLLAVPAVAQQGIVVGGSTALSNITGLGTGIATALGINVGSAGAPVLFNGAGGTPSSLVATNATGTAASLTAGAVTTNANLTGDVTSVGNATTFTGKSSGALGQIPATATNDNAAAGKIGEYISSSIDSGSAVALTSGVAANTTSISLTAGDWDVTANAQFLSGTTTTITQVFASLSLVSATLDATSGRFNSQNYASLAAGSAAFSAPVGPYRVSLASTTTLFLAVRGSFSVSTLGAYGLLSARRVR